MEMITTQGLEALHTKLHTLKNVSRKNLQANLVECRSKLTSIDSNTDEYGTLEFDIEMLNKNIRKIETAVSNCKIINEEDLLDTSVVKIGHKIELRDITNKEKYNIQLLSAIEADPMNDIISVDSPLGIAILGKSVGNLIILDGKDLKNQTENIRYINVAIT